MLHSAGKKLYLLCACASPLTTDKNNGSIFACSWTSTFQNALICFMLGRQGADHDCFALLPSSLLSPPSSRQKCVWNALLQ